MKEYCEKAKKLSKPNAPIFNFTNPSGLVTQAMHSYGYDNVYGVCDAPSGFIRQLKDISDNDNLSVKCFGLNHLSWFYDFKIDGKDVTDEILSNKKLYTDTEMRLFDKELISMCENFLPNEYLYFYYYREKAIESVLSSKKTRGEDVYKRQARHCPVWVVVSAQEVPAKQNLKAIKGIYEKEYKI